MTLNLAALLAGLFLAPAALLLLGHRLRRRSPRLKRVFWGAVMGHIVGAVLALNLGMVPPEAWGPTDLVRGLGGFWALLILPVLGAVLGAVRRDGGELE